MSETNGIKQSEFERWMELLRNDIHGVHERLDTLNGRTRRAEQDIAVLKDRGTHDVIARVVAGIGAALAAGFAWFK